MLVFCICPRILHSPRARRAASNHKSRANPRVSAVYALSSYEEHHSFPSRLTSPSLLRIPACILFSFATLAPPFAVVSSTAFAFSCRADAHGIVFRRENDAYRSLVRYRTRVSPPTPPSRPRPPDVSSICVRFPVAFDPEDGTRARARCFCFYGRAAAPRICIRPYAPFATTNCALFQPRNSFPPSFNMHDDCFAVTLQISYAGVNNSLYPALSRGRNRIFSLDSTRILARSAMMFQSS